jgi:hypothetical protein
LEQDIVIDKFNIDPSMIAELYPPIAQSQAQSLQNSTQDFKRVMDQLSQLPLAALEDDGDLPIGTATRPNTFNGSIVALPTLDKPYIG